MSIEVGKKDAATVLGEATQPGSSLGPAISGGEYEAILKAYRENTSAGRSLLGMRWGNEQRRFLESLVSRDPALGLALLAGKAFADDGGYLSMRLAQARDDTARAANARQLGALLGVGASAETQVNRDTLRALEPRIHALKRNAHEAGALVGSEGSTLYMRQFSSYLQNSSEARALHAELRAAGVAEPGAHVATVLAARR